MAVFINKFFVVASVLPALLVLPAFGDNYTSDVIKTDASFNGENFVGTSFDTNGRELGNFSYGGRAFVRPGAVLTVNDSKYYNNTAFYNVDNEEYWVRGTLFSARQPNSTGVATLNINNSEFKNNFSKLEGGAIADYGVMNIIDSDFIGNKSQSGEFNATYKDDNNDYSYKNTEVGGGAIALGSVSVVKIQNSHFANNTADANGGAIKTKAGIMDVNAYNDGLSTGLRNDNSGAKLDIINTNFANNASGLWGGALYNTFYHSVTNADSATISESDFNNNTAACGGAIYNDGRLDRQNNGANLHIADSTFTNNTATTAGGAIYNTGVINLSGTNTFVGNKAKHVSRNTFVSNDIYNEGTLNIVSGTTNIDGGITGTGTLVVADGATLDIGTAIINQRNIDLSGATLNVVFADSTKFGQVIAQDGFTANADSVLNLKIASAGDYKVFNLDNATCVNTTGFSAENIVSGGLYDVTFANGVVTATTKSVETIATSMGVSNQTAAAIVGLTNSSNQRGKEMSLAVQDYLNSGDDGVAYVEKELKKATPEEHPVAQSVASAMQNHVLSLTGARMSGNIPGAVTVGRSGGDVNVTDGGVWAQGLYNRSKLGDKFHGNTFGVAAGMDTVLNRKYTLGIGYAHGDSDIHASNPLDIESNTLFLYGQYKPAAWYVNAAANYTLSEYKNTQNVIAHTATINYDVNSFGAQVATGYDFMSGLTPEVAARYLHVSQDSYANILGQEVSSADTDFLTGTAGMKYAFNVATRAEWVVRPELRVAAKYDFLSDKGQSTVVMPGTTTSYIVDGERLSRFGGEFGIGLTTQYRQLQLSLNYDLDLRKDYTSQTGMAKIRYAF